MSKTSQIITVDASILVKAATNKWGQKFSLEAIAEAPTNENVAVWWGGAAWYVAGWQHNYQGAGGWTEVQLLPLYYVERNPAHADSAQYLWVTGEVHQNYLFFAESQDYLSEAARVQEARCGAVADSALWLWRHSSLLRSSLMAMSAEDTLRNARDIKMAQLGRLADKAATLWSAFGVSQESLAHWSRQDVNDQYEEHSRVRAATAEAAWQILDEGRTNEDWLRHAEVYEVFDLLQSPGEVRLSAGPFMATPGSVSMEFVMPEENARKWLGMDFADGTASVHGSVVYDRATLDVLDERDRQVVKWGTERDKHRHDELSFAAAAYSIDHNGGKTPWDVNVYSKGTKRDRLVKAAALAIAALQAWDAIHPDEQQYAI